MRTVLRNRGSMLPLQEQDTITGAASTWLTCCVLMYTRGVKESEGVHLYAQLYEA